MFVDIENFKGTIGVENILMPYKKGRVASDKKSRLPKETITPQVCMQILKSTNNPVNIKHMLECIEGLPEIKQAQFKEIVLAVFVGREQPEKIIELGRELAHVSGYDTELADVLKPKDGEFLLSDAKGGRGYRNRILDLTVDEMKRFECFECTDDEFSAFQKKLFPHQLRLPKAERVYFTDCDFEGVNALTFHPDAVVYANNVSHLPEKLDVSMCQYFVVKSDMLPMVENWTFSENGLGIDMRRMKPSADLDLSRFGYVNLMRSDLKDVSGVHFRDGAVVILRDAKNLPPNLDFSKCIKINLSGCDLSGQQELSFRDGADVDLDTTQNLPKNIDFSRCSRVILCESDLKNQPNLRFADGAEVTLHTMDYLPANLDFSRCAVLDLFDCNLQNQPNLRFADGAKVRLIEAYNTPKVLDFSPCSRVRLVNCKLDNTLAIIFKNQEQYENSDMGLFVKEDMKIFFADKMSDGDWKEIENLKIQQNNGLKNMWRNMKILWGR